MSPDPFFVLLEACDNPDLDPAGATAHVPREHRQVLSLAEAQRVCLEFIAQYDLGSGNWAGGRVTSCGKGVAYISYNGRAWTLDRQPTPIHL